MGVLAAATYHPGGRVNLAFPRGSLPVDLDEAFEDDFLEDDEGGDFAILDSTVKVENCDGNTMNPTQQTDFIAQDLVKESQFLS